jgi:chemotaxis protein MotD
MTHSKRKEMTDPASSPQSSADAEVAASPEAGLDGASAGRLRTTAKPAATPAGAAAAAAAAAPVGLASVAPAPARTARAKPEADEGGTRKPNLPSASDAANAGPADAVPAPKAVAARKDGGEHQDALPGNGGSKAAPEARRIEPQPAAAKVTLVGQQAVPAPVAPALSANAAAVVATIAGEQGWRFAGTATAGSALASKSTQPMRSLKIELHPAELGTVTANLKASGGQLSVELKVENHEAYARLSADSDAIVKSLRSLGYDIDRVSIQQPQAATTVVAGADASAGQGQLSRDTSSFQPGSPGSGSERFGGQTNRQGSRNDGQHHAEPREIAQDRAGGSLYI